ncbi:golgin subfamily A member 6-like protein 22 [Alligator mississippiensis]|uniref:golgin subfamily A member 6-like protein 22 n=1 Tax=Alligator mississippiensis TaxID=8496 RepID=UPI0028777180|nr:golgin subfamily A member 6-like protein 22 [Alligator mississippiensis]
MGDQRQEKLNWQLRMDEMEEKVDRLKWELGMAKSQKERAEAQVAALELQMQSGKKEGGSKEIRRLVAIETEKRRAIEQLIAQESQRDRAREEKLNKLKEEMIAEEERSQQADTRQAEEQKKLLKELEVARGLIGVLQKEAHSQEDQIGELQEELESWQQRSMCAEDLTQELRDQLSKSHTQARETDKIFMHQVEQMKNFGASYEMLGKQMQSPEEELKIKERENEQLQTQLKSMEGEKEKLEQQIQSLKAHIEDSLTKEKGIREEKEQLQREVQKMRQEIQSREMERKVLQEANEQMAIKIQNLGEVERPDERQESQTREFTDTVRERLEALGTQLAEYVMMAKWEHQEQYQEVEVVKGPLKEVEAQLETAWYKNPKHMELEKFPRVTGPEEPREEAEPGLSEGSTREEGAVEKEPMTLQKEALPALIECWNQRWEQWQNEHAKEMSQLKHQLKELLQLQDKRTSINLSKRQPREAGLLEAGTTGKGKQRTPRREASCFVCQECTQAAQDLGPCGSKRDPGKRKPVKPDKESGEKGQQARKRELPPKGGSEPKKRPQIYVNGLPKQVRW